MADKTNDEKLKILQERLAQIKQKNEQPNSTNEVKQEKSIITDINDAEENIGIDKKKRLFYRIP